MLPQAANEVSSSKFIIIIKHSLIYVKILKGTFYDGNKQFLLSLSVAHKLFLFEGLKSNRGFIGEWGGKVKSEQQRQSRKSFRTSKTMREKGPHFNGDSWKGLQRQKLLEEVLGGPLIITHIVLVILKTVRVL